jgi:anti-sigma regulatory factor (Ser/Thr protein kinase)
MGAVVTRGMSPVKPEARFKLKATPGNARVVRELIDITLIDWSLNSLADSAKLIVSELFTNAVKHGTPGEDVWLLLTYEGEGLVIGVWDSSQQMPKRGRRDQLEESGRGLYLVESIADAYGAYRVREPQGKIVWARLGASENGAVQVAEPNGKIT